MPQTHQIQTVNHALGDTVDRRIGLVLCLVAILLTGADWRQFRGNTGNCTVENAALPTAWTDTHCRPWSATLPGRGVSGPIVVKGKVIVTSASGVTQDRLHVLSFDAATGKLDWHRQYWATGRTVCHPTSSVAAPTPASDGQRIYAFYSSNDLAAIDLEGNLLWLRGLTYDYPSAANDTGMASSPLASGNTVVVQVESQGESFAAGIDAETGLTRWRVDRPSLANWASPSLFPGGDKGQDVVLLESGDRVTAHNMETGVQLWTFDRNCSTIPSPTVADGVIYIPCKGLTAVRPNQDGTGVEELWNEERLSPNSASAVIHRGRVYTINRAGVLAAADIATGKLLWQLRLSGTYWATPLAAGDHIYVVNEEGQAQVVRISDTKGEIASEYSFGEAVLGTPAAADGALYVRGSSHLWKIAQQ